MTLSINFTDKSPEFAISPTRGAAIGVEVANLSDHARTCRVFTRGGAVSASEDSAFFGSGSWIAAPPEAENFELQPGETRRFALAAAPRELEGGEASRAHIVYVEDRYDPEIYARTERAILSLIAAKPFPWRLAAAGGAVCLLMLGLLWWSLTPGEVRLTDRYVNAPQQTVIALAESQGLRPVMEPVAAREDCPGGVVCDTDPPVGAALRGGTWLSAGDAVTLKVAQAGAPMPPTVGLPVEDAREALRSAGFVTLAPSVTRRTPDAADGEVLASDPPPGVYAGLTDPVTLITAIRLVTPPDVRGQTYEAARAAIEAQGIAVEPGECQPAQPPCAFDVTGPAPAPLAPGAGETVTLTCTPTPVCTVPGVPGGDYLAFEAALTNAGLKPDPGSSAACGALHKPATGCATGGQAKAASAVPAGTRLPKGESVAYRCDTLPVDRSRCPRRPVIVCQCSDPRTGKCIICP